MSLLSSPHDRKIFSLAIPALGGLAVDPLVSLVDTAFVGQLGTIQLAALGVNASIFAMSFVVFNFLAYGTTPRVGNAVGAGDIDRAGRVIVQAFTIAIVAGIVALAALQIFANPILAVMGATGELREPALDYLRIRAFAGPAVLLITAGRGAFRGVQNTRTPLRIIIVMNLVNLVLDPLFIFVAGWGLMGAAAATAIAQWTGALVFVGLIFGRKRREMGVVFALPKPAEMVPFLKIGWQLLMRTGALVGTMTLATAVAARLSVTAVAAHQIGIQLWAFMALVIDALAVAGQALVSKQIGQGHPQEAKAVANRLLQLGLALGLLLGAGFWMLQSWLPRIFTHDPETTASVLEIFVFIAVLQPLNGLVFVWDGIFMGAEKFRFLAVAMLASAAVAATLLLLVVPMGWGLEGVWWGITSLMAVRVVTLGWAHSKGLS